MSNQPPNGAEFAVVHFTNQDLYGEVYCGDFFNMSLPQHLTIATKLVGEPSKIKEAFEGLPKYIDAVGLSVSGLVSACSTRRYPNLKFYSVMPEIAARIIHNNVLDHFSSNGVKSMHPMTMEKYNPHITVRHSHQPHPHGFSFTVDHLALIEKIEPHGSIISDWVSLNSAND